MLLTAAILIPGQIFQFPQKDSAVMPVTTATAIAVLMIILVIYNFNLP